MNKFNNFILIHLKSVEKWHFTGIIWIKLRAVFIIAENDEFMVGLNGE